MYVSDALFGQKRFSFGNLTRFFNKRWTRLYKSVKEVSPQITISESAKSGREQLIFSYDSHKSNFQLTTEQKID